jgi:hypothetical protein
VRTVLVRLLELLSVFPEGLLALLAGESLQMLVHRLEKRGGAW